MSGLSARAACLIALLAGLAGGCNRCARVPKLPRLVEVAPPEGGGGFPYVFTDDYHCPRYTYFRSEGLGVPGSLPCAGDYIEKYKHKKLGAATEEVAYFDAQAKINQQLRAEAHAAGCAKAPEAVRIGFVGDIMWIRNNWDGFLGDDVREAMDTADFWIGNLETVVSKSTPVRSEFPDYARYNSAPGLVRSFRRPSGESRFKALSIANNHSLDFDEAGARETIAFLDQEHILHNGLADTVGPRSYAAWESKGIKFGFYAATWDMNKMSRLQTSPMHINVIKGFAPPGTFRDVDIAGIVRALDEMKQDGVDFKIVSLHWGYEFEMYPDPLQVVVARQIVKAGADVIMGTHPHVEQPMEVCFVNRAAPAPCRVSDGSGRGRKALVLYSLGNFTTAKFTPPCQEAPMHEIAVSKRADGQVDWDFADSFTALNDLDYGRKQNHHLGLKR